MRLVKWLGVALVAYVGLVVAFECLVGFMGKRQAESGSISDPRWLVISTADSGGSKDTVIAGVELDGQLYVAANHWPRGWYHRAIQNPDVEVTRGGEKKPYRAVPLTGDAEARVAREYVLPFPIRFLTGFPPRSFLRLDPR